MLGNAGSVHAQVSWNTTTGSWFVGSNWHAGLVPEATQAVYVTNGGTVQIAGPGAVSLSGELASAINSSGTVEVSNNGTWVMSGFQNDLSVGRWGTGTLRISGSGEVRNSDGFIGYQASANGTVEVSGGKWINETLTVAASGTGKLVISGTGEVTSGMSEIGSGTGSNGTVEVSGGRWTTSETLYVGNSGTGSLDISGTGLVDARKNVILSYFNPGTGTITLRGDGNGRGVLLTGQIVEGPTGSGKVVFDGGILRATRDEGGLMVGFETGDVEIRNGGAYVDTNGFNVTLSTSLPNAAGQNGGLVKLGDGTLRLQGLNTYTGGTTINGGTLQISSNSNLGSAGGSLVFNGGKLRTTDTFTMNRPASFTSFVATFDVADSTTLTQEGSMSGTGWFAKEGGGTLVLKGSVSPNGYPSGMARLGTQVHGGKLVLDGASAALTHTTSRLELTGSSAEVVIENGADVSNEEGHVTGTSKITVTGSGSTWTNRNFLYLGRNAGTATLELHSDGQVSVLKPASPGATSTTYLGFTSSSTGTANVSGGTWTNAGDYIVGYSGTGVLNLSGTGIVNVSGNSYLSSFGGTGTANISGGTWNTNTVMYVAYTGTGTLTLSGTGVVTVALGNGQVVIGETGNGVVNLGDGTGTVGTLNASEMTGGTFGTSKVNFNHTQTNYTFNPTLTGKLAVEVKKGTTTLGNANTYTGGTTVSGGTLLADNSTGSATGTGAVQVNSGGTLGGSGFITGAVTVADGGTIAPGSSPETLTLGELALSDGSNLNFELGTPGVVGNGVNDLIDVVTNLNGTTSSGNLTLDGRLNITALAGFGEGTYTIINYDGTLTDNTLVAGLRPAGYNFTVDASTTPGSVLVEVDYDGLQFWDGANTTDNQAVDGGSGVWNNSLTNWTNADGHSNTNWQNMIAVFKGPAGTVDLAANVTVQGMQFATDAYEIQTSNGSTITLGTTLTEVLVDPNATVTIGAEITGNAGLVKQGLGTLVLTAANTYGSTLVLGGTLKVNGTTASIGQSSSTVGVDGPGATLVVENGATVTSANGSISLTNGSSGLVEVTGGKWTNSTFIAIGFRGTGTLKVSGTGEVSTNDAYLGFDLNSKGVVEVSGGKWTVTNDLVIGGGGSGELYVSGGEVNSLNTVLGLDTDIVGLAEISGGQWTNTGDLTVGEKGTGTVTLTDTGVLTVGAGGSGTLLLAENANSKGTLNIGDGGVAGTLEATSVDGGSGTAKVVFNHSDLALAFDPLLTGSLATEVLAGTTILTKANTYSGGTLVNGGTLVVNNTAGSATGTGEVVVAAGRLTGTGFIDDTVRFTGAATLAPGSGPGTLTMGGLIMQSDTVLDFDLGTPGVIGNNVNDFLEVTGDLTLDGLLNITDAGGFDLGIYRLMNYGGALTNNGLVVNSLPAGINPGSLFVDVTTPGQVNLIHQYTEVQFWDGPGNQGNGRIDGGGGIWIAGAIDWTNAEGLINGPWAGQAAVFTGSPGTVILGSDIPFQKLIFAVSGYRIESPQGYALFAAGDGTVQVDTGRSTISAPMVILGSFFKTGGGLLDLRSSASAAATFIQAGSLAVNGTLQSPYVNVSPGATLQGIGIIIGNVFNSGTVAPGNSIGRLTIHGNYTQRPSGTLEIEVASTSHHDVLAVSGTAKLAGTLEIRSLGYRPKYGDQIPFLLANRITGKFSHIDMPNPDRFRGRFFHADGVGVLLVAPTSYTLVARTGNEHHLAVALDEWIGIESGDIGEVTLALDLLGEDQYAQAFAAIGPAYIEGALSTATELSQSHTQMLHQQLNARRLTHRVANVPATPVPVASAKGAKAVAPQVAPEPDDARWSAWIQGSGLFSSGGLSLVPGEDFESGTILVGADYLITEHFAVGLFASYQEGWGDYAFAGDMDMESVRFGAYATLDYGGFYANAAIGGGQTGFDIERPIQWATLNRLANSEPDGYEFFTSLAAGYDYKVGNWTFGPQLTVQYNKVSMDEFNETGAGALNLHLHEAEMESLRSYLGGRIAYTIQVNDRVAIIPEVRAFWQHEYLDGDEISAALDSGFGPAFTHETQGPDKDSVYIGAGVGIQIGNRFYGNIYYNVDLGRNEEANHTVSISATWKF